MPTHSIAKSGYAAATTQTRTPKGLEYEAMARITHRLQSAEALGVAGFGKLAEALLDNRKLWNIFAIEAANTDNPLPQTLRAKLFYLFEFTNHHTSRVLSREADVAPLIEVNTAIMRGLRAGVN